MHTVPYKEIMGKELNQEWMQLIREAKDAGLTVEDVRRFLINAPYLEEEAFLAFKAAE